MGTGGKGGARHHVKPHVDTGLLLQVFCREHQLLQNMGAYEQISKTQACNPLGLVMLLPLVKGLIELEPTAEIHGNSLRGALYNTLLQYPSMNEGKYAGQVWVNLRIERLTVVLGHMRRLKCAEDLRHCASKLTGGQFSKLQEVVEMVDRKRAPEETPAVPVEEVKEERRRDLKKELSEVSVDSSGFPTCLATPVKEEVKGEKEKAGPLLKGEGDEKEKREPLLKGGAERKEKGEPLLKGGAEQKEKGEPLLKGRCEQMVKEEPVDGKELAEPSFKRRRKGSFAEPASSSSLQRDLGLGGGGGGGGLKKRPAARVKAASQKKPAAPVEACYPRKKWSRLTVTKTSKPPWRAYVCGCHEGESKVRLIVETTAVKHRKYDEILDIIIKKLEEEHLTKEEARALRQQLYDSHPA